MSEPIRHSLGCLHAEPAVGDALDISAVDVTALDETQLINEIDLLPRSQWPWGVPQEARIRLLRFHPEPHCTFEIDLCTGDGWRRLIGKVYATDRQDIYQVMEALRLAGFGPEEEFSIPRAVSYLPSLRLLLQERINGTSAKDIFKCGEMGQCTAAAERCGRWLARFQTLAPRSGRTSGTKRLLNSAERKCRLLCEADHVWVIKSEELLERLRSSALSLDANLTCPGHGDYCEHQIIFTNRQTVVLDWDLYDIAHPARDVAKFIVSLERLANQHHGSIRALDSAADAFLKAYLDSSGYRCVPPALPFYKAVFWLKGRTKAIQTSAPGWREQAETMLLESLRNIARINCP